MAITSAEQIAELTWIGNHASDSATFGECDAFIKASADREAQRRALYLMVLHGMGIDEPVTDAILDEYLQFS